MTHFKAFALITRVNSTGDNTGVQVTGEYKIVASDGSPVANLGNIVSAPFAYSDSSETIHQALADLIRTDASEADAVVIFLDSHGRY